MQKPEAEPVKTRTSSSVLTVSGEDSIFSGKIYAKRRSSSKRKSSSVSSRRATSPKKPYVLKEGCKYTLYTAAGKASISGKASDADRSVLEKNGIRLVIQNCNIVENSRKIPVYVYAK
jgi:hypothetical protein